jgi:GrpB-like predicted nucleotidyltransferase (UPF0157 family)
VERVHFEMSEVSQPRAAEIVQAVAALVRAEVPSSDVQDMGATAIPGLLTKGDVDVSVRVDAEEFPRVVEFLGAHFNVHQRHNWTNSYASFADDDRYSLPVGIQATVVDGREDTFVAQRDRLAARPQLIAEYNALKRRYEGADMDEYRAAKHAFIAAHLR